MTPPLDAKREAMIRYWHANVAPACSQDFVGDLLREIDRLRATQRESEYESVPRTAIECELIEAPTSMTIGESVASSPFEACNGESGGDSVSVPRDAVPVYWDAVGSVYCKMPRNCDEAPEFYVVSASALSASQRKETP